MGPDHTSHSNCCGICVQFVEICDIVETRARGEKFGEDFAWTFAGRGPEGVGLSGLATGSQEGTKFQRSRRRDSMPGITLNDLEVARTAVQISDDPTDALKMIEQYMDEIQTANLGEHQSPLAVHPSKVCASSYLDSWRMKRQ